MTDAGFAIPYFSRSGTNSIFAQNVDADQNIKEFIYFSPALFASRFDIPNIELHIGEPAFFAFVCSGNLYTGAAAPLSDQIRGLDLSQWPFTAVDAAEFLKDSNLLQSSLASAGRRLRNDRHRNLWQASRQAIALGAAVRRPAIVEHPDPAETSFLKLEANFDDVRWGPRWIGHRQRYGWSDKLDRLAITWMKRDRWDDAGIGEIIGYLLRSFGVRSEAVRIAFDWLISAPVTHPLWGRTWMRLPTDVSSNLRNEAMYYLRVGSETPGPRDWRSWIDVWRKVSKSPDHRAALIPLAVIGFHTCPEKGRFVEKVLVRARAFSPQSEDIDGMIRSWLLGFHTEITRSWGTALLEHLRLHPADFQVRDEAIGQLRSPRLPGQIWFQIWRALTKVYGEDANLNQLANDWILNTPSTSRAWVKMAIHLLERSTISPHAIHRVRDTISHPDLHGILLSRLEQAFQIYLQRHKSGIGETNHSYVLLSPGLRWRYAVLEMVRSFQGEDFNLNELYKFVPSLAKHYPSNYNIESKIRQQLQVLRDLGVVEFVSRGHYRERMSR